MKELYELLKKLEEKWGIDAYNDLLRYWSRLNSRIEELKNARDKWRIRAETAENKLKEIKNAA